MRKLMNYHLQDPPVFLLGRHTLPRQYGDHLVLSVSVVLPSTPRTNPCLPPIILIAQHSPTFPFTYITTTTNTTTTNTYDNDDNNDLPIFLRIHQLASP